MRKLATFAAAAALVTAFGHAGTAKAQTELLTNGDAETGDLTGWATTASTPAAAASLYAIDVAPIDTYAFDMDPNDGTGVGAGNTATLQQTVPDSGLGGCNLNVNDVDLQGTWALDAFYVTRRDAEVADFGTISIEVFNGRSLLFVEMNNLISPDESTWVQIPTTGGDVPVGTDSVDVTISGTQGGVGSFANVGWDDVSLLIDCVIANARISGTMGVRPGRKDSIYAFGGAVGTLEGGDVVGAITIDYRELGPTRCTFTPTTIYYTDDTSVEIMANYECTNDDEGTATIYMTARDAHASCDESDKSGRKNRSSIAVDAADNELDISDGAGASSEESCLATGNVIIAGPVE